MFSFNKDVFHKKINSTLGLSFIITLALLVIWFMTLINYISSSIMVFTVRPAPTTQSVPSAAGDIKGMSKFASSEEFREYLEKSQELVGGYYGAVNFSTGIAKSAEIIVDRQVAQPPVAPSANGQEVTLTEPTRFSETNVQVSGIDEPDIVKTDGKEIYFSKQQNYYFRQPSPVPMIEGGVTSEKMMPQYQRGGVKIIKAFPPADLKKDGEIEQSGNLLLSGQVLVVFAENNHKLYGYDISKPQKPEQKWTIELDDRAYMTDVRLRQGKIYLVARNTIDYGQPCPFKSLSVDGAAVEFKCSDVYRPNIVVPSDITYTALTIDVVSGKVEKKVAFIGNSSQSVLYMSDNAIYATYAYSDNLVEFFYNFLQQEGKGLLPDWATEKIKKLMAYDISYGAKMNELGVIMENYSNSLSDDDRLKFQNESENRLKDYTNKHIREIEKTGVVKINLADFSITAVGNVPGAPLNQFSLDEYNGYLRIATTIGGRFWDFRASSESVNDVYVLDKELKISGSVKDLGKGERIYSARFLQDKGYVVTFRQTDPFYVLDLSNPQNPQKKGELKIPGFSSYLHPISKDKILGVGREDSNVKLSLFDVANSSNPIEVAKYTLDEYWSEVSNTHHAFLMDTKHQIFFLPGSKGGYIFSYQNDILTLKKAVSLEQTKRALYIGDYLYIISENEIIVLNENDWQKVNNLAL